MEISPQQANSLIRNRRAVFPKTYTDQPISKEIIDNILENANWAPTHKRTEPWRFRVLRGKALGRLSVFLADHYKATISPALFSELKYNKNLQKPLQSACVIAVCMQRDPKEQLPEWEEIAAVACAVQNMWLTASAYGIGAYWSSPKAIKEAGDLLRLRPGERCLGFFYMGYSDKPIPPAQRQPIEEKVIWMDE